MGLKGRFLKLRFHTVDDLIKAKRYIRNLCALVGENFISLLMSCHSDVMPAVRRNRERAKAQSAYDPSLFSR